MHLNFASQRSLITYLFILQERRQGYYLSIWFHSQVKCLCAVPYIDRLQPVHRSIKEYKENRSIKKAEGSKTYVKLYKLSRTRRKVFAESLQIHQKKKKVQILNLLSISLQILVNQLVTYCCVFIVTGEVLKRADDIPPARSGTLTREAQKGWA